MAAPVPELEPPVSRVVFQGLRDGPYRGLGGRAGVLVATVLAHDHRTGIGQTPRYRGILVRDTVCVHFRAIGGQDVLGVDNVFEADGNTVQRPQILAGPDTPLRFPRGLQGLVFHHRDVGIDSAVKFVDSGHRRLHQVHRRNLRRLDQIGNLGDG